MQVPFISLCGLTHRGNALPHIWTATSKVFSISFHVPTAEMVVMNFRLFGVLRSKVTEQKYNRCYDTQPDEDLVTVEDETLSVASITNSKAKIFAEKTNAFMCTVPPQEGKSMQFFTVTFECLRNHWQVNMRQKFMMFVLQIVLNDTFMINLRVYAQKTTPAYLHLARDEMDVNLIPVKNKPPAPAAVIVKKEKNYHNSINNYVKKLYEEYSSPETAISGSSSSESDSSDNDKRTPKRRYTEEFILDTSPLPQELIVMWSNVFNSDSETEYNDSPGPVINTFDVTYGTEFLQDPKRVRYDVHY